MVKGFIDILFGFYVDDGYVATSDHLLVREYLRIIALDGNPNFLSWMFRIHSRGRRIELTRSKTIIIFISWSLVLLWMGVIYGLSAQVATESNALSHGVTEVVVETIEKVVPSASLDVDTLNHFVRKNAHFLAYLLLGMLVSHALARNGLHGRENAKHTLMICVLYAVSEEAHQMLVPGRGPAAFDVMIDSFGVCMGLSIYYFMHVVGKRVRVK